MRPKVDESLCFVCQKEKPTFKATRGKESFLICSTCKVIAESENKRDNAVKASLRLHEYNHGRLFTQLLGGNLASIKITFEAI